MPTVVKQNEVLRVPDIVEYQVKEAQEKLAQTGFVLVVDAEEFDQQVNKGAIISQNPAAFTLTKKGRRIHVIVSKVPQLVKMRDLTGISLRQAKIFIQEMGLEIGQVFRIYSTKIPKNVVVKQGIAPDSLVPLGTEVDLTISSR